MSLLTIRASPAKLSPMLHYEEIKATEADARHLMIVLHGLGDSLEGYRFLPSMLNCPWLNYALVNAPDPYFGGFSWYDIPGDAHPGVVRSRGLLFELLDHFRNEGYRPENIYLLGFSQGCLMTWESGMRYTHELAACVGISGAIHQVDNLIAEAAPVALKQHFLITHGHLDPIIPLAPVKEDVDKVIKEGLDVEWRDFMKEHTIAGGEELDVIRQFVAKHRRNHSE